MSLRAGACGTPEVERAPGDDPADDRRVHEGVDPAVVDVLEMLRRDRAELGGETRCPHLRDLIGVDLGGEPVLFPFFEHAPRLVDGERGVLAEHVAKLGEAVSRRPAP